jgi:hypothetical protein
VQQGPTTPDQLALINLNGDVTDIVFEPADGTSISLDLGSVWSPDGNKLLFGADNLYIANIQEKHVVDTCIPTTLFMTAVWSSNNSQIAIFGPDAGEIQIFDVNRWQRYTVAYASGQMIGWRSDD